MQSFDTNRTNLQEILYQVNSSDSGELAFQIEGVNLDGGESLPFVDQIRWSTNNSVPIIERLKSIKERNVQTTVWTTFKSIKTLRNYLLMHNIVEVMIPTKP